PEGKYGRPAIRSGPARRESLPGPATAPGPRRAVRSARPNFARRADPAGSFSPGDDPRRRSGLLGHARRVSGLFTVELHHLADPGAKAARPRLTVRRRLARPRAGLGHARTRPAPSAGARGDPPRADPRWALRHRAARDP